MTDQDHAASDTTSGSQVEDRRAALLDGQLGSFVWDSREAVAYEVALEAIHRALGAISTAVDLPSVAGDPAELARLERERWAAVEALGVDPTDHTRVREIRTHFNQLAAGLPAPAFPGL